MCLVTEGVCMCVSTCVCGKVLITHKDKPGLVFVSAVQSCLFQGNNAKLSVGTENGSVLPFSM